MEARRKPTYDELLEENAQLKIKAARVDELETEVVSLKQQVADLQARVDKLTKMLFGKKSERSKKANAKTPQIDNSKSKRDTNGGGGRKPFPPEIPRRNVHVNLSPDECCCDNCGQPFEPMGVEISEVLNYIPMTCEVIRFIRQRMKPTCTCIGNKIVIAEMPIRTIDKGTVTTEMVAAMLVNKYCDHLPVYRQVRRMFKNMKLDIAESSVCRWRDVVGDQLEKLVELMTSQIKQSHCINTDATTAPCRLPKEQNRQVNGNMYVYIGGDDRPYNVFNFQPNQTAAPIHQFLHGYSNVVQCDAHGNYDALFNPKTPDPNHRPPIECGCHAHCRRGFKNAEKTEPDWAKRFLAIYKKLYKIEADKKNESIENRFQVRQCDSLPLLDALFDLCRECKSDSTILPKSPLG